MAKRRSDSIPRLERVVVLGRGGTGKSTLARTLGMGTGLPVIELDKHFWQPGSVPISHERWTALQRQLLVCGT